MEPTELMVLITSLDHLRQINQLDQPGNLYSISQYDNSGNDISQSNSLSINSVLSLSAKNNPSIFHNFMVINGTNGTNGYLKFDAFPLTRL